MEDKNIEHQQALKGVLKSLDKVFSMVFVLEMVLKVTAYGPKKYLSDAWCWLDFIIVAVSEPRLVAYRYLRPRRACFSRRSSVCLSSC